MEWNGMLLAFFQEIENQNLTKLAILIFNVKNVQTIVCANILLNSLFFGYPLPLPPTITIRY